MDGVAPPSDKCSSSSWVPVWMPAPTTHHSAVGGCPAGALHTNCSRPIIFCTISVYSTCPTTTYHTICYLFLRSAAISVQQRTSDRRPSASAAQPIFAGARLTARHPRHGPLGIARTRTLIAVALK